MERGEAAYSIRSVHRVCDILDLLKQASSVPLPKIAEAAQLPKTSAFRYLTTLESRHYVQRDPVRGSYRLGSAFLDVPKQRLEVMATTLRPQLEELCDLTGETINLGVLDGRGVLYLDIVEPPRGVRLAAQRGDREPIHCSALGKALAAQLPAPQVETILRLGGMPARTPATITDPDEYKAEVERTSQRGYAIDDCENEPDGRCVAVPLFETPVPAAVSLSAPAARFPTEETEEAALVLTDAAKRMTETLASD